MAGSRWRKQSPLYPTDRCEPEVPVLIAKLAMQEDFHFKNAKRGEIIIGLEDRVGQRHYAIVMTRTEDENETRVTAGRKRPGDQLGFGARLESLVHVLHLYKAHTFFEAAYLPFPSSPLVPSSLLTVISQVCIVPLY